MPSNLESTPHGTAVAAFLLRAYGFKQKDIYDLMVTRGIDMSIYTPTVGGAAHKNLGKALFTQPTRDRTGGSRGAPDWLPAGVRLGDHLSQRLGFSDEQALEDYTQNTVGALSFTPSATMGGLSAGSAQRNLVVAHWDWTGTNAATVVNGDTGGTAPHSMGDAIDEAQANASFNLAALVAGAPVSTTPPAPPAPAPITDDTDDPVPPPVAPAPAPAPAPVAPTVAPLGTGLMVPGLSGEPNHIANSPWLNTIPVADLPVPGRASRALNRGTWEGRSNNSQPDAFPSLPDTSNQKFYPAIGPIYLVLDTQFPGKDFGPGDDVIFRMATREGSEDRTLFADDAPTPHYRMVIGLKRGKSPQFYLIENGIASDVFELQTSSASPKSKNMGEPPTTVTGTPALDFSIEWSVDGVAEVIRFETERSGARGGNILSFEVARQTDGTYAFTQAPEDFMTTSTLAMDKISEINGETIREIRIQTADLIEQSIESGDLNRILPADQNPNIPPNSRLATIMAGQGVNSDDQDILIYGIQASGLAGRELSPNPNAYEILGNSLIFPNRVQVYTNVDQYVAATDESSFLSRVELDWDSSPGVVEVYNSTTMSNSVVSMQLRFQDASDTTTEYSGINPDDRDSPREQRIYLPGDVPYQLLPLDVPMGSTITSILAYPAGSNVYQRIRVHFATPDGVVVKKEFPDASNRMILRQPGMFPEADWPSVSGRVVSHSDAAGNEGFVSVSELDPQYATSHQAFINDVMDIRMMERTSDLNTSLPFGDVKGVGQVIWRDGGSYNILVPNPDVPDEMILIVLVHEEPLQ